MLLLVLQEGYPACRYPTALPKGYPYELCLNYKVNNHHSPYRVTLGSDRCRALISCSCVEYVQFESSNEIVMIVCDERVQRFAMLTSESFHCQLMAAACGQDTVTTSSCGSKEYRQQLALDILCWIIAIQMNDISTRFAISVCYCLPQ